MEVAKQETVFIYLAFGSENIYRQCLFSTGTLLVKNTWDSYRVAIVTDNPPFFEKYFYWENKVKCIPITQKDIEQMRGRIDFVHRVKIASIELVTSYYTREQIYVYLDCDTFIKSDLKGLVDRISPFCSIAHKHEFYFSESETSSEEDLTRMLLNKIRDKAVHFHKNGKLISMNDNFSSWNAGVLGIHRRNIILLDEVYELTDALFLNVKHHAAEQFAFSYILENSTKIVTCESEIIHYWKKVKKEIALDFFRKFQFSEHFVNDKSRMEQVLPMFELLFTSHILYLQDQSIQFFNKDDFFKGYKYAILSVIKSPLDFVFIRHVIYHTRRILTRKISITVS